MTSYIVSIGSQPEFRSSMDFGLRMANSDMLRWLTTEYGLTDPEAHMLMGGAYSTRSSPTSVQLRR